jgi:hypothetical protein
MLAPPTPAIRGVPPVFIVGFWRTGTTFLHELLALDRRVGYLSCYQCMAPGHAHWSGPTLIPLCKDWSSRRAMDNVILRLDSPQEDEFFLLNDGARSFYEMFLFPGEGLTHLGLLDPSQWDEQSRNEWWRGMERMLQSAERPGVERILLKSPTHAFRLPLLAARYPRAAFINIERGPLAVFLSTRHTFRSNARLFALDGTGDFAELDDLVIACYREHRQRVSEARLRLSERWVDLRYEELLGEPEATLARLYRRFGWTGFDEVRPTLSAFLETQRDFRPNRFDVSPEMAEAIRARLDLTDSREGLNTQGDTETDLELIDIESSPVDPDCFTHDGARRLA